MAAGSISEKELGERLEQKLHATLQFGDDVFNYDKVSQWLARSLTNLGVTSEPELFPGEVNKDNPGVVTEQFSVSNFLVNIGVASWKAARGFKGANTLLFCNAIDESGDSEIRGITIKAAQFEKDNNIVRSIDIKYDSAGVMGILRISSDTGDRRKKNLKWHFESEGEHPSVFTEKEVLQIFQTGAIHFFIKNLTFENFAKSAFSLISGDIQE